MSDILNDTDLELQRKIQRRMLYEISVKRELEGRELSYDEMAHVCSLVCLKILNSLDKYAINQIIEETRDGLGMTWDSNRQRLSYYEKFKEKMVSKINSKYTSGFYSNKPI